MSISFFSGGVAVVLGLVGLSEGGEGFEHVGEAGGGGCAGDEAGDGAGGCGGLEGRDGVAQEDVLGGGGVAGPGGGGFGAGDVEFRLDGLAGGGLGVGGGLIVRAEPADEALAFLGAAFGVQGDDAGEDVGVGEVGGPAIGGGDGCIETVMQVLEQGDLPGVMDIPLGGGEGGVGAEFFEDVVEEGEGELGMCGEAGFAVRVEFLGDGGDQVVPGGGMGRDRSTLFSRRQDDPPI